MTDPRPDWVSSLELDVRFGYLQQGVAAPQIDNPALVLNTDSTSVLRTLRTELRRATAFDFSVAFVTPRAIALLKQELVDFRGQGRIVTSDYLAFNSPHAFEELLNLGRLGIDVRVHDSKAFHPKGYVFQHGAGVSAVVGSANLTETALVKNHEWNLRVSAAHGSDLAEQFKSAAASQVANSKSLSREWIDAYAAAWAAPAPRTATRSATANPVEPTLLTPNGMQTEALAQITSVRDAGHERALVISATGTGKTILSALAVKDAKPNRLLFIAHREQILDQTMDEYQRVLGGSPRDYGKLSGTVKQADRRYVFATVQTVSQSQQLAALDPTSFDYIVVDETHRAGAKSHLAVIEHFKPKFLLGMTATPERTDGFNIFELFDYVVPYEIRLNRALEEEMLAPFHYYGVADIAFEDGTVLSADADLNRLVSSERVSHLLGAIETYGQAGVRPRGLIFCSKKAEAHSLSAVLNESELHGQRLRTRALTGDDSITERNDVVAQFERGDLDYLLTVDIFNEGIDIPSVNQVVMLRQTESAIVFVQQLGRGLRKAEGKEYLVVIDFIGNYANNFLIPIALFGDESLNKESLRKNLIAAEENGVIAGLSSVRFDKIAQKRILESIANTQLSALAKLKPALVAMQNRVGGAPRLWDFYRFQSTDPVLLATVKKNYLELLRSVLKVETALSPSESRALTLLSQEVMAVKRIHEFVLLKLLKDRETVTPTDLAAALEAAAVTFDDATVQGAFDTLTLTDYAQAHVAKYRDPLAEPAPEGGYRLAESFRRSYAASGDFADAVDDLLKTGAAIALDRYERDRPFTVGRRYSRKDALRNLGWPVSWYSTVYGYKADVERGACPIFITLHKSADVDASVAYADELLDVQHMRWSSKSNRTLVSNDVKAIGKGLVDLHVFVKKDDADGSDHYYLGKATAESAVQTTMPDDSGKPLPVVHFDLRFDEPIEHALYDYFHPRIMNS